MSHGTNEYIYAKDANTDLDTHKRDLAPEKERGMLNVDREILVPFGSSVGNKTPKIFVIEACRGGEDIKNYRHYI